MQEKELFKVTNLTISFRKENVIQPVVHQISFSVFPNEILGIVGESGSGKSVTSLAAMGLLPDRISKIDSGEIIFKDENLLLSDESSWRKIRGNKISMIFQEPMSSLNPSMTCGEQVEEILKEHTDLTSKEISVEVIKLFEQVKLPFPKKIFESYPHQISGGQKQRVMIAMAIACKPDLLIADEPTTALDVTVQKEIIELLMNIQCQTQMSIIFISHDLALISEIAKRVLVMFQGKIVEQGATQEVFNKPKELYTKALIASRPSMGIRLKRLPTIKDFLEGKKNADELLREDRLKKHQELYDKTPLLEVKNLNKYYLSKVGWMGKSEMFHAVKDLNFAIFEGETLGLVGESGCGKSTLGNAILLLDKASSGQIFYRGKDISNLSKQEERNLRKEIQIIFQDPFASLNPRITIGKAIQEPMEVYGLYENKNLRKEKVIELLNSVGMLEEHYNRFPHEFSGGQRQRIGIARAISLMPKLIVCDESVSALDISVQAQVLNLLNDLKEQFDFTYLFISHDLAVVKYMSDRILVMNKGEMEVLGEADEIYKNPKTAYTRKLIESIPGLPKN